MTVDERAKAYMHNEITQPQRLAMYEAYKDGAYDQRQIDIEKACEWLMSISKYKYINTNEELCVTELAKDFRKAMEE